MINEWKKSIEIRSLDRNSTFVLSKSAWCQTNIHQTMLDLVLIDRTFCILKNGRFYFQDKSILSRFVKQILSSKSSSSSFLSCLIVDFFYHSRTTNYFKVKASTKATIVLQGTICSSSIADVFVYLSAWYFLIWIDVFFFCLCLLSTQYRWNFMTIISLQKTDHR